MARWQYPQFFNPIAGEVSVTGGSNAVVIASDDGPIANPILIQYQSIVGPVLRIAPVAPFDPATSWIDTRYPSYLPPSWFRTALQYNISLVPQHNPTEGSKMDWVGWVPTWIARWTYPKTFHASLQQVLRITDPAPLPRIDWCPVQIIVDTPKDIMVPSGMDPSKLI